MNHKLTQQDELAHTLCDLCGAEMELCRCLETAYRATLRLQQLTKRANRLAEALDKETGRLAS